MGAFIIGDMVVTPDGDVRRVIDARYFDRCDNTALVLLDDLTAWAETVLVRTEVAA
jgi:hypothetical protein